METTNTILTTVAETLLLCKWLSLKRRTVAMKRRNAPRPRFSQGVSKKPGMASLFSDVHVNRSKAAAMTRRANSLTLALCCMNRCAPPLERPSGNRRYKGRGVVIAIDNGNQHQ